DAGREYLTYKDWLTARDARLLSIKQPILSMSSHDRRTIAYHEAGHAIASHYLNKDDRIQKASIIRMGDAYGVVMPTPKLERHQLHAEEIENDIMVSLGSRAVEAIAGQLLQRGELIGPELDEIFEAADLSNPEMAKEFVRRPVNLPKMSDLMKKEELPPGVIAVPVAASDLPGQPPPAPIPGG